MRRRAPYLLLWIALVAVAAFEAPPTRADSGAWVMRLIRGEWGGENAAVVALFNVMGVWPWLLAARLRDELFARRLPAWPFVLLANVGGAFVLLLYFVLRPEHVEHRPLPRALAWIGHPVFAAVLGLIGLALAGWAVLAGDLAAFLATFREEGFVHIMIFDFLACHAIFVLATAERASPTWAWVPVLGSSAQLVSERVRDPAPAA